MSWIDFGPWDSARGTALVKLMTEVYPQRVHLLKLLNDSGIGMEPAPSDQLAPTYQWHELLTKLLVIGKLRALITIVATELPALRDRLDGLTRDDPAQNVGNPPNPFQVRLIGPRKRPMINRTELRDYVEQLFGDDRVVLTVRGPGESGKSHSYLLMRHVSRGRADRELLWFNFAPADSGDTAKHLLSMICRRVRIEGVTDRPNWTTATTFTGEMMDDFVGAYKDKFRGDGTTRIFVIDGLERFEPGSDVYSLAARLALEVAQDQLPNTQLVLIGYSDGFDPAIDYAVNTEDVKDITRADLRLYFDGLATDLGIKLTRARRDALVREAMTGDPGLAALSDRVQRLAIELIRSMR